LRADILCDDWDVVCAEPWVRRKNSIKATAEAAVVAAVVAAAAAAACSPVAVGATRRRREEWWSLSTMLTATEYHYNKRWVMTLVRGGATGGIVQCSQLRFFFSRSEWLIEAVATCLQLLNVFTESE
jgi:hypothetical protein